MTIPREFDIIKTGKGYTMKGWDFNSAEITEALKNNKMLNPAFELGTNACPLSCFFCFTEDSNNPLGLKKRLNEEMSLERKLKLIDESRELGAKSINFVGAGEPLIDPDFWKIIEYIKKLDITPIVYTEGTAGNSSNGLHYKENSQRLYNLGATIVLKVNSLTNETYQNNIVFSATHNKRSLTFNYLQERNKVLDVLIKTGFNSHDPTRLAFDTIICKENINEIPDIHRYARNNNIFVLFVNYLPSGRSSAPVQNALSRDEQFSVFKKLADIDEKEYSLEHRSIFPYAGSVPCSIRGLGLYVKIGGKVYGCPPRENFWNKYSGSNPLKVLD